jgi:hypothetical protein
MTAKKDRKKQQRAKKRKVQRDAQSPGQPILHKRVQSSERLKEAQIIVNPPNTEKMSEVILRFAEPLKDAYGVVPEKMIHLAILVWNTALLPNHEHMNAIKTITQTIAHNDRALRKDCVALIDMLLKRKQHLFADNKRFIYDHQVSRTKGYLHLDVVATLDQDK